MSKTLSIKKTSSASILFPRLEINIIFERDSNGITPTLDALLYQDILKYGTEQQYENGFRFTQLANWLMKRNDEFYNYYTGSKSRTPPNARVAKSDREYKDILTI